MDMGALLTSGFRADEGGPSHRRKHLKALFRGRVIMELCGAGAVKGQNLLERVTSEGAASIADELATVASCEPEPEQASTQAVEEAVRSLETSVTRPPSWTRVASPSLEPPRLPSLIGICGSTVADSVATETLVEVFQASESQMKNDQLCELQDVDELSSSSRDEATPIRDTEDLKFGFGQFILKNLNTIRAKARKSDVQPDTQHELLGAGLETSQDQKVAEAPLTIVTEEEPREIAGFGLTSIPCTPKSPRRHPPKPLSATPIAGRIVWGTTPNGCMVEMPQDPTKELTPAARRLDSRKLTVPKQAPMKPSGGSSPRVLYGGRPLSDMVTTPGSRAGSKVALGDETVRSVSNHRMTVVADMDTVGSVRRSMGSPQGRPTLVEMDMQATSSLDFTHQPSVSKAAFIEVGLRVKNWRRKRTGTVIEVSDGDMFRVKFDDGDDGWRQIKMFEAEDGRQLTNEQPKESKRNSEFRLLVNLSRKYHLRLDELKEALEKFRTLDSDASGEISLDEFKNLIRHLCNVPQEEYEEIPYYLMNSLRSSMDRDDSGTVSFEEFVLWNLSCAYSEEMMVSDPHDRHLRQLARERGLLIPDVEKIKNVFDSVDTDGSGKIEEIEFRSMLYKLMNAKSEADVSEKRLHRYWRELDADGDGAIGFDEFLGWYCKSFGLGMIE